MNIIKREQINFIRGTNKKIKRFYSMMKLKQNTNKNMLDISNDHSKDNKYEL